jgi:hypothetical protein
MYFFGIPALGSVADLHQFDVDLVHFDAYPDPKWHPLCSLPFQDPKKYLFHGPPIPMSLEMDIARTKKVPQGIRSLLFK